MSSLKSAIAILESELNRPMVEVAAEESQPKPKLVSQRPDKSLTRRVEAALDRDFANGSMPA